MPRGVQEAGLAENRSAAEAARRCIRQCLVAARTLEALLMVGATCSEHPFGSVCHSGSLHAVESIGLLLYYCTQWTQAVGTVVGKDWISCAS